MKSKTDYHATERIKIDNKKTRFYFKQQLDFLGFQIENFNAGYFMFA